MMDDIFAPLTANEEGLFGPVDMAPMDLTEEQVSDRKMVLRIEKNAHKFQGKIAKDIAQIYQIIEQLGEDDVAHVFSDSIDSPNIINAFIGSIEELYLSTWAITPAGIQALVDIGDKDKNPFLKDSMVMLDRTHSYKWMFKTGAAQRMKGKIRFKFASNHAKFQAIKLTTGETLTFVGSFNLSNNPRYENTMISRSPEWFEFYKSCVLEAPGAIF